MLVLIVSICALKWTTLQVEIVLLRVNIDSVIFNKYITIETIVYLKNWFCSGSGGRSSTRSSSGGGGGGGSSRAVVE